MNYYDELIDNIENLINNKEYDQAKALILNELNMIYVPSDIENKLNDFLDTIKQYIYKPNSISNDDILNYLNGDENHQLIAVDELGKRNLRDYIDVCSEFLKNDRFVNAKALLIDSLIKQDINYEFEYVNKCSFIKFNPIKMKIIEETEGFIVGSKIINETYMKDASKAHMALELLYKEAMLSLPIEINGIEKASNIIKYIDSAFSAK